MLKKLIISFCLAVLVLFYSTVFAKGVTLTPTPTSTVTVKEEYTFGSMTTYEMFWPIVAGKVPGDRFYSLKLWRDKMVGFLFFSKIKKSEYLKQLANKRLVEAERLLELQRDRYFTETLRQSTEYLEKGSSLLLVAPESQSQIWLKGEYTKDLQKHLVVLERMKEKVEENKKTVVGESIKKVNDLIKKHGLQI